MKAITIVAVSALLCNAAAAVAQPQFGEQGSLRYRDCELLVNPATTGATNRHLLTLALAKQWVGFASPVSEIVQYQLPATQVDGIGVWLYNDAFGVQHNTQFGAAYAHTLQLGRHSRLSLGLSTSLLLWSERFVEVYDPSDKLFAEPVSAQSGFNTGFGAHYFTDSYYIGASIPQLLTNSLVLEGGRMTLHNYFEPGRLQYYLTGGYRFALSELVHLSPALLVQLSGHTPAGYEGALTAGYSKWLEVEVGWASHGRMQFGFGITLADWMSVRYQYAQYTVSDYYKSSDHLVVVRFHWKNRHPTYRQ
jgi:type IX secretion system PorP/SprF family membrane protein